MFSLAIPCPLFFKSSAGEQATTDELHELASMAGIEPATSAFSNGALPAEKYPLSTPPANDVASLVTLPLLSRARAPALPESRPASACYSVPREWPAWSSHHSSDDCDRDNSYNPLL